MRTQGALGGPISGRGQPSRAGAARPWLARAALGLVAAVLVVLAYRAPLWTSTLHAPQYPQGLRVVVYGDRVGGDVREVTALNHYVGMRPFEIDRFPEVRLWAPAIALALVAVVVSQAFGRRWPGRAARLVLWAIPLGILADIQWRLYGFGHDLVTDPRPALPIEPFTPRVIGPTRVLNFTNTAWLGRGVLLLFAAAALLGFGPGLARALRRAWRWLDQPVGTRAAERSAPSAEGSAP